MPPCCIIINPWAGRGSAGQQQPLLEAELRRLGVPFELVATQGRGDATARAAQALERGCDQIVAAGGDGTINEVVNAIMGSRERGGPVAALGIVPLGTGSDFVKVLDGVVANDCVGAARRLALGHTRPVDVGVANGRYFINGVGMGLDAQVALETTKISRLKGVAVYLVAVIRALAHFTSYPMTVRFDDYELHRRLLFASVANGRCQGGTFWMTPTALIDDGLLDLCLVERMGLPAIIRHIPDLMEGTHTRLRWVTMGRARRITVDSSGPMPFATDGEVIGTDLRHIELSVVPQALEVIV